MARSSADAWNRFHSRWNRLQPPLRPNDEVTDALASAIGGRRAHAILLGVTPELAGIAEETTAIDHAETMIANVWPGDTATRRALLGRWQALPLTQRKYTAVLGDGSFNTLLYADYATVFCELARVLAPGARIAVRLYETPEPCETLAEVRADVMAGRERRFHAFKWRLAMALAAERGEADVPVVDIHRAFEREFPDRAALARATGWNDADFAEMDAYQGQEAVYSFPTRRQMIAALPASFVNPQFVSSGRYALAERCPIFVADFAP